MHLGPSVSAMDSSFTFRKSSCWNFGTFLIVLLIQTGARKFAALSNDLLYSLQKVLLTCHLPPTPDCIHACLSTYGPEFCTSRIRTQPGDQIESDPALDGHATGVNAKDIRPPLEIWQGELHPPIDAARSE